MAKSTVYGQRDQTEAVSINMTPMIDIVFQLIIFFILASQFVSKAIAPLDLAGPVDPQFREPKEVEERKIIVNVLSKEDDRYRGENEQVAPGALAWYEVMGDKIGDDEDYEQARRKLSEIIKDGYKAAEKVGEKDEFYVELRADYRVSAEHVGRVLQAAVDAGVDKVNFTATKSETPETGS